MSITPTSQRHTFRDGRTMDAYQHPNGGGWVAMGDSAQVANDPGYLPATIDPQTFLGPKAEACGNVKLGPGVKVDAGTIYPHSRLGVDSRGKSLPGSIHVTGPGVSDGTIVEAGKGSTVTIKSFLPNDSKVIAASNAHVSILTQRQIPALDFTILAQDKSTIAIGHNVQFDGGASLEAGPEAKILIGDHSTPGLKTPIGHGCQFKTEDAGVIEILPGAQVGSNNVFVAKNKGLVRLTPTAVTQDNPYTTLSSVTSGPPFATACAERDSAIIVKGALGSDVQLVADKKTDPQKGLNCGVVLIDAGHKVASGTCLKNQNSSPPLAFSVPGQTTGMPTHAPGITP